MTTATEFLRAVTPPGTHMTVVAIHPVTGKCIGEGYDAGNIAAAQTYVDAHPNYNLYWTPNPLRQRTDKKPTKDDVAEMRWVHLDLDDPSDEALARLRGFRLPPTLIIFSGGGYQAFWRLREPVRVNGNLAELESANRAVMATLGGDKGTHNIDRVMRLPGTTNWPTKTKLAKGRVPAEAKLVEHDADRTYLLDEFIAVGPPPEKADRSADLLAQVCKAVQAGRSDQEIHTEFDSHVHAIDQADPQRAVQRCIDKARSANDADLVDMNGRHAVVNWTGRTLILTDKVDPVFGRMSFELSSPADLKTWYANAHTAGKNRAEWWLRHPQRRQYSGVVFAPGSDVPGHYNLWRGFGVEPKPGDCSLWLTMVHDIICSGDAELYRYVVAWCADAVQNPTDRPGVVLVLLGPQGTGKGTFALALGDLFGQHFLHIRHSRHLVGNFNAHLANCLLLFADEAHYPGDKQSEGALKALITEPSIPIEFKGKDVVNVQNYLRVVMASNQTWVVPAAMDDRRFCVIEVSSARAQDTEYFGSIRRQLGEGGSGALLSHLLNYDLGEIDLRRIPETRARYEQQVQSLDAFAAFWLEKLNDSEEWRTSIMTSELWEEYRKVAGLYPGTEATFGVKLKRMFPSVIKARVRVGSEYRLRIYRLPDLATARTAFEQCVRKKIEWEVEEVADEKP